MKSAFGYARIATALGVLVIGVAGCTQGPLLASFHLSPTTISPNPGSSNRVAVMDYELSRPAYVWIYLEDAKGQKYSFREREPRAAGRFEAKFNGVVNDRVLADGQYRVVVEVVERQGNAEVGERQRVEKALAIRDADTSLPEMRDFMVFPTRFTPNRDGYDDRIAVTYYLAKEAWVEVYLVRNDDPKQTRYYIAQKALLKPGQKNHDYEGGVDLGNTPPPDGEYTVIAEATDAVGNRVIATAPLAIAEGGVPLAEIQKVTFSPTVVPLDELLKVEITVKNVGTVAIRSKGPYSGEVYTTSENFNTKKYFSEPGIFRVGVDSEGNSSGREYPYRWGFPGDRLEPGQEATIVGYIRIVDRPPKVAPYFWAGLVHEDVRKVNDHVKATKITIGF
ncbi:MAG: hypothetical protein AB1566_02180 [Chloroflexota bacterium]